MTNLSKKADEFFEASELNQKLHKEKAKVLKALAEEFRAESIRLAKELQDTKLLLWAVIRSQGKSISIPNDLLHSILPERAAITREDDRKKKMIVLHANTI